MFVEDKGIVLRCVKYDDKSFIAHLFTASRGYVAFMVSSSRGKRSTTTARLFQPLSFLAFQWNPKPTATLHRMKDARLVFVQQDIPYNPIKLDRIVGNILLHKNKARILHPMKSGRRFRIPLKSKKR